MALNSMWIQKVNESHHRKKLQEIMSRQGCFNMTSPDTLRLGRQLKERLNRQVKSRAKSIAEGNKQMVKKLNNVFEAKKYSPRLHLSVISEYSSPRSLNFSYRKEQAKKIFQENKAIAKRLDSQSPCVSFKRLGKDFQRSQDYKKCISRVCLMEKLEKINTRKLAAINWHAGKRNSTFSPNLTDGNSKKHDSKRNSPSPDISGKIK